MEMERQIRLEEADSLQMVDAWIAQEIRNGGERIRQSVARLEATGIVDADGRLLPTETPADMRPESQTDVTT